MKPGKPPGPDSSDLPGLGALELDRRHEVMDRANAWLRGCGTTVELIDKNGIE